MNIFVAFYAGSPSAPVSRARNLVLNVLMSFRQPDTGHGRTDQ
jgi:hypothetical protein